MRLFGDNAANKNGSDNSFAVISLGMHVGADKNVRPVYCVMRSFIAAALLLGMLITFITACPDKLAELLTVKSTLLTAAGGLVYYCTAFSLSHSSSGRLRRASAWISCGGVWSVLLWGIIRLKYVVGGAAHAVNLFMGGVYSRYMVNPMFRVEHSLDKAACTAEAWAVLILLLSAVICMSTVGKPNILFAAGATAPLAIICLYYGLVPNYTAFAVLMGGWCASLAAEVTGFGAFDDENSRGIFTKTSAQSAFAAMLAMLLSFTGASVYAKAHERPESADEFRIGFLHYMRDFTFEKFVEDIRDAYLPSSRRTITHDGKLGNVESVEFDGSSMLDVIVPEGTNSLYLKGFTASEYTGSRWNEGAAAPILKTKITSPEFFSGRVLQYFDRYGELGLKSVTVRNSGAMSTVKYYPVNGAGLMETDGRSRRYGVYFPDDNWREYVIKNAGDLELPDEMRDDEQRLRSHAYANCLAVPETFTAAEDFFADYTGTQLWDELVYIREKLSEDCEYTLDAGKKPFGADFAQWFLTDGRQGSCTHFASAAVLLCRTRGIPARYCEGFTVKESDIKSGKVTEKGIAVTVPDNRAHAWAEIYIDGYGWLYFETTPGYGNVVYTGEDNAQTSAVTEVETQPPVTAELMTTTVTAESVSVTDENGTESAQTEDISTETVQHEEINTAETQMTDITTYIEGTVTVSAGDMPYTEPASAEPEPNGGSFTSPYGDNVSPEGTSYEENTDEGGVPEGMLTEPSETTAQTDGEHIIEEAPKEPLLTPEQAENLKRAVSAVLIIAAAAGLLILRYRAVIIIRKRLICTDPDRAARDIFRKLRRAAGTRGIVFEGRTEDIPSLLSSALDTQDSGLGAQIVTAALEARFGRGISAENAQAAAEEYNAVAAVIFADKRSRFAARLISLDRYV